VELPSHLDDRALARQAAAEGIFLAPGSVFRPERAPAPPAMRVNVAYVEDPRFLSFMRRQLAEDAAGAKQAS
jgi:DNA-binding transcriptional MocR family regulator